jgi:hypothetical protein
MECFEYWVTDIILSMQSGCQQFRGDSPFHEVNGLARQPRNSQVLTPDTGSPFSFSPCPDEPPIHLGLPPQEVVLSRHEVDHTPPSGTVAKIVGGCTSGSPHVHRYLSPLSDHALWKRRKDTVLWPRGHNMNWDYAEDIKIQYPEVRSLKQHTKCKKSGLETALQNSANTPHRKRNPGERQHLIYIGNQYDDGL